MENQPEVACEEKGKVYISLHDLARLLRNNNEGSITENEYTALVNLLGSLEIYSRIKNDRICIDEILQCSEKYIIIEEDILTDIMERDSIRYEAAKAGDRVFEEGFWNGCMTTLRAILEDK